VFNTYSQHAQTEQIIQWVKGIEAKNASTNIISLASGTQIYEPNTIIQTLTVRSDLRTTYASPITGNGTTIDQLRMTIVPKFSNSILAITFMINGEVNQDNVFLMHRNDTLITDASYEGYNNVATNVRSSGIASGFYDQNEDSTPSNWYLQYFVAAVNTTSRTYAPAIRTTAGTAHTFAINRTINGASQDAYERMVSTGTIMEILQ
jgi:hypothetical protein